MSCVAREVIRLSSDDIADSLRRVKVDMELKPFLRRAQIKKLLDVCRKHDSKAGARHQQPRLVRPGPPVRFSIKTRWAGRHVTNPSHAQHSEPSRSARIRKQVTRREESIPPVRAQLEAIAADDQAWRQNVCDRAMPSSRRAVATSGAKSGEVVAGFAIPTTK